MGVGVHGVFTLSVTRLVLAVYMICLGVVFMWHDVNRCITRQTRHVLHKQIQTCLLVGDVVLNAVPFLRDPQAFACGCVLSGILLCTFGVLGILTGIGMIMRGLTTALFLPATPAPRLYKGEDTSTADDEDTGVPLITVA